MIRLPEVALPNRAAGYLRKWQDEVDGAGDYAEQVEIAKKRFPQRNKRGNATFDAVKKALTAMCQNARRCVYCEDSVADEVEHIAPKDLYPEQVFTWDNYVYACGPCNGPKNARFAVVTGDGALQEVTRKPDDPIAAPAPGDAALINPRREDPLPRLLLDLETLGFTPVPTAGARDQVRATFTIDVLRLAPGSRDYLQEAWVEAVSDFEAHFGRYVERKAEGASEGELAERRTRIQAHRHPTVWQEMKRQRARFPALDALFNAAPEALDW